MIRLWLIAAAIGITIGALTVIDPMGRLADAQVEAEGQ